MSASEVLLGSRPETPHGRMWRSRSTCRTGDNSSRRGGPPSLVVRAGPYLSSLSRAILVSPATTLLQSFLKRAAPSSQPTSPLRPAQPWPHQSGLLPHALRRAALRSHQRTSESLP